MSQKKMNTPMLFACADNVTMPHVGADESSMKKNSKVHNVSLLSPMAYGGATLNTNYLKKISSDLIFTEDVVREKAFHALPYDQKYFTELLDYTDVLYELPKRFRKVKGLVGRHNSRVSDKKHLPCHLKKRAKHYLKPLKRHITDRGLEMEQCYLKKQESLKSSMRKDAADDGVPRKGFTTDQKQKKVDLENRQTVFLTAGQESLSPIPPIVSKSLQPPEDEALGWDAYMLNIVSKETAQWMVHQRTSPGEHREKLSQMLDQRYGPPLSNELVSDSVSDPELCQQKEKPIKKWKKQESVLLQAAELVSDDLPTDPYSDETGASFYRLPAGTRKLKKVQQKEDEGNNLTAKMINVTRQVTPPPPTMKDFLNPKVGTKIFDTENEFEREWLTGEKVVHQIHGDATKIVMENNNKYKKKLRKVTPRKPEDWFAETKEERKAKQEMTTVVNAVEKGVHRWTGLPDPIDVDSDADNEKDTAEVLNLQHGEFEEEIPLVTAGNNLKKLKNSSSLLQIIDDWRAKWHLNTRFSDATPDDLLRDMADIHPHIRIKAITTCARAAEFKPPPQPGIAISSENKVDFVSSLPEKIFVALGCLCNDPEDQVKRAAAITLYVLNRPNEKAEEILRSTLSRSNTVDRWAAVQCLAHYGATDSEVIGELVTQLLNTEDGLKYSRCAGLLSLLSQNTTLVHSMIAEQLNSSSWRHRVMACKVIPRLYGTVSRDLSSKLTNLMWSDWHGEVRKAAAQTLGKTGHGVKVHDRLKKQLCSDDERQRVDALNKIGKLGIMTAKLLPSFLSCFDDEYLSVRMETCVACSNLRIQDPLVCEKLIFLASYDPIWKIKALAIQALGQVGRVTPAIRRTLLWALRYEEKPGVRAEACHSLILLGFEDNEVQHILQDRFLVESSEIVKAEIAEALDKYGISDIEDIAMVAKIKDEVRKLCTRNNICAQIASNEAEEDLEFNRERLIYRSKSEKKLDTAKMYRAVSSMSRNNSPLREPTLSPGAHQELDQILHKEEENSSSDEETNTTVSGKNSAKKSRPTTASGSQMRDSSSSFYYGDTRFSEGDDDSSDEITNFSPSPSPGRFESSAFSMRSSTRMSDRKQGMSREASPVPERVALAMKSETVLNLIKKHDAEDYQLCHGIDLGESREDDINTVDAELLGGVDGELVKSADVELVKYVDGELVKDVDGDQTLALSRGGSDFVISVANEEDELAAEILRDRNNNDNDNNISTDNYKSYEENSPQVNDIKKGDFLSCDIRKEDFQDEGGNIDEISEETSKLMVSEDPTATSNLNEIENDIMSKTGDESAVD